MKHIKKLNIDFDNWDEAIINKFNIGDKVKAIDYQIYLEDECDCSEIQNLSIHYFLETNILFGKKLTIVNVCENYIKLKGYRVWFLIDTFKKI